MSSVETVRKPVRKRTQPLLLPPSSIETLADIIDMANTGARYQNIDTDMLWRISAQLIEINNLVGMKSLKESILNHVIYYLQNLFLDDERDYLHTVIIGPPGCGKCVAPHTSVLYYDGTIQESKYVKSGDILMGDDGSPRIVRSVCSGSGTMYDIDYLDQDGRVCYSYTVNSVHVLSLVDDKDTFVDIPLNEYMAMTTKHTLCGYKVPIRFTNNVQLDIDPYIMGYCMLGLRVEEEYSVDFHNSLTLDYFDSMGIIDDPTGIGMYTIDSSYFEDYKEYIENHRLPDIFWKYSHDTLLRILAGILDVSETEGTHVALWSNNTVLIAQVKRICDILAIPYIDNVRTTAVDFERDDHTTERILNLHCFTIDDYHSQIPRIAQETQSTFPGRLEYQVRVTQNDTCTEYIGWELDGNGRFLLQNGIVTHNTTVARIIGEMYKNMGILSPEGVFKIAKREDFIAEYLGQTAVKTKKLLESCIGGVLFIDEVYALGPGKKESDSFSKEAIDTLNVFLSEHAGDFCCIIAGYEDDIKNCFFSVNQGLERRFQWVHRIESYSIAELAEMFFKLVQDIHWKVDPDLTRDSLSHILEEHKLMFKAFGGDIENLITKCKMAHARRIISLENPRKFVLTREDVLKAIEMMTPHRINVDNDPGLMWSMYT